MISQGLESRFSSRLAHIGIVVREMDTAVKRLEELGIGPFKPFDQESLPPLQTAPLFRGKPIELGCKVFVAKLNNYELELFEPDDQDSPWKEFLDTRGEGIHHLAFSVKDIDRHENYFSGKGAEVLLSGRWQGGGSVYLDFGTGGIIVELEEL